MRYVAAVPLVLVIALCALWSLRATQRGDARADRTYLVSGDPDIRIPIDSKTQLLDPGGNDRACDLGCISMAQREASAATRLLGDASAEAGAEAVRPTLDRLPACWSACRAGPDVRWSR